MINNPKIIQEFLERVNSIPAEDIKKAVDEVLKEERKRIMSDYVRKKCVRFKIPQNIIDKLKNEDEWLQDLLLKEYNVKENYHTKNDFTINSGLNYENDEYEYFLDYQLDYEYGASGDFENVRLLTDTEFEKYSRIFAKYFNEIGRDELRLVHYCYYNGVDEPSIYELEEI